MLTEVESVWQEYHDKLHRFILRRIDNPDDAEDILHDVFLRIFTKLDSLRDGNKLPSWLYRITRNAIIDHYRGKNPNQPLPASLPTLEEAPGDQVRKELSECMLPMIESLPEHYKQAVYLSEIAGLTQKEVAVKQGLSLSGAKTRIQRGRAMIKDLMSRCCRFVFDRQGNIMDYHDKKDNCIQC